MMAEFDRKDEDLAQSVASGLFDAWGPAGAVMVAKKQRKKPAIAASEARAVFFDRVIELCEERIAEDA